MVSTTIFNLLKIYICFKQLQSIILMNDNLITHLSDLKLFLRHYVVCKLAFKTSVFMFFILSKYIVQKFAFAAILLYIVYDNKRFNMNFVTYFFLSDTMFKKCLKNFRSIYRNANNTERHIYF